MQVWRFTYSQISSMKPVRFLVGIYCIAFSPSAVKQALNSSFLDFMQFSGCFKVVGSTSVVVVVVVVFVVAVVPPVVVAAVFVDVVEGLKVSDWTVDVLAAVVTTDDVDDDVDDDDDSSCEEVDGKMWVWNVNVETTECDEYDGGRLDVITGRYSLVLVSEKFVDWVVKL